MNRPYPQFQFVGGHRAMSQKEDVVRLRDDSTGKECVLSISRCGMQVYSLGADSPSNGQWHAPADDTGVTGADFCEAGLRSNLLRGGD